MNLKNILGELDEFSDVKEKPPNFEMGDVEAVASAAAE